MECINDFDMLKDILNTEQAIEIINHLKTGAWSDAYTALVSAGFMYVWGWAGITWSWWPIFMQVCDLYSNCANIPEHNLVQELENLGYKNNQAW